VAGITWQGLHFLCGLRDLGFDVYYVEAHGNWVADPTRSPDPAAPPRVPIAQVMRRFGFERKWICRSSNGTGEATYGGFSQGELPGLYARAEAIINLSGAHVLNEEQLSCPRRVYLETDPGIPQIRLHSGDEKTTQLVDGHTHHFTWAENLYGQDCRLPPTHLEYGISRQPVIVDFWRDVGGTAGERFTTIARWKKRKNKTIEFEGEIYHWDKSLEFMKYLDLPVRSGEEFELALSQIGPEDTERLRKAGWTVTDGVTVSATLDSYRHFIRASRGEFTIAKDQYAALRTGWFADRSACYLAAGRPVIAQDTGYSASLPTGEGLFGFSTVDDVLAAVDAIRSDYDRHARAAAEIAREYFGAERVLGELLDEIGLDVLGPGRLH
jgi:hypothetical protein